MAINKLSGAKCLELVITIACLILHYKSMGETDAHIVLLTAGTFVGFTVILIGVFAGYLLGTPINKRIDIFFSLIGCAMFIATGVLLIQHWEDSVFKTETRKLALSKGSLAIVNGVVFLLDTFFTFRD